MPFFLYLVAVIAMNIPQALGYGVVLGKQKVLHFGPVGVGLLAAYGTYAPMLYGVPYEYALLIGLGLTALGAISLSFLSLRLPEDAFGVLSLASHLVILAIVLNWSGVTRGALGIPRIPRLPFFESPESFAITSSIIAVIWIVAILFLERSRFGRAIQALAELPLQATALGLNRARITLVTFLIGAFGAFCGSLQFVQYIRLLYPNDYGFPAFIFLATIVIAGKPTSVLGVSFSTVLLVLLREAIRFLPLSAAVVGPIRLIVFGLILFVAVTWRRKALFPPQRTV